MDSTPPLTLPQLVTRGAQLDAKIKTLGEELKGIRAHLVSAGHGEHRGENGERALVVFPSPVIKPDADAIADAQICAGRAAFGKLFERVVSFKPRKGFREIASAVLTPAKCKKLIERCEVESAPQVRFSA